MLSFMTYVLFCNIITQQLSLHLLLLLKSSFLWLSVGASFQCENPPVERGGWQSQSHIIRGPNSGAGMSGMLRWTARRRRRRRRNGRWGRQSFGRSLLCLRLPGGLELVSQTNISIKQLLNAEIKWSWLAETSHVTWNIQSECFISV